MSETERETAISYVPVRKRSSPYNFTVVMELAERSDPLYDGRSFKYAMAVYWNSAWVVGLTRGTATVRLVVKEKRRDMGGFLTRITAGTVKKEDLHAAYGDCQHWGNLPWSERHLVEKLVSTIPGTLGISVPSTTSQAE